MLYGLGILRVWIIRCQSEGDRVKGRGRGRKTWGECVALGRKFIYLVSIDNRF